MKAIGIAAPGSIDTIQALDLPVLVCGPHEILIKVEYVGVNAIDLHNREGVDPLNWFKKPPFALGSECAGTVVELPKDEAVLANPDFQRRGFKVGTRVVTYGPGALAEYMVSPWLVVYPLPENVSTRDGAAAMVQAGTAHVFLSETYPIRPGDYILVHTVAGGCGLLFAQLIKLRGGIVIGTTSTPEKAAIAKELGADHVILYKNEDVVSRVLEITDGKGVHAVLDGVGKDTFENDFKMIRTGGWVVLYGSTSGAVESLSPQLLQPKSAKLTFGSADNYLRDPKRGAEYVAEVFKLIGEGVLKITVQNEYPFTADGVREAHLAMEKGTSVGKLLIKVVSA